MIFPSFFSMLKSYLLVTILVNDKKNCVDAKVVKKTLF